MPKNTKLKEFAEDKQCCNIFFQCLQTMDSRWFHFKGTSSKDGVSLRARRVVFRPSPSERALSSTAPPSGRVTGIDPGKVDTISAVDPLQDGTFKRAIL